jgi:hypothetical protein
LPARRDCSMASASATTPSQNPSSCDTRARQTYYWYEASRQTSGIYGWSCYGHACERGAAACERGATVMHGACERVEVWAWGLLRPLHVQLLRPECSHALRPLASVTASLSAQITRILA